MLCNWYICPSVFRNCLFKAGSQFDVWGHFTGTSYRNCSVTMVTRIHGRAVPWMGFRSIKGLALGAANPPKLPVILEQAQTCEWRMCRFTLGCGKLQCQPFSQCVVCLLMGLGSPSPLCPGGGQEHCQPHGHAPECCQHAEAPQVSTVDTACPADTHRYLLFCVIHTSMT